MGLIAWVTRLGRALHRCAESIHRAKETKPPAAPNQPVEVRAVVSFSDETLRNTKAENDRAHATQKSIKNATWFASVAVTIYALITLGTWWQMIRQGRTATQ